MASKELDSKELDKRPIKVYDLVKFEFDMMWHDGITTARIGRVIALHRYGSDHDHQSRFSVADIEYSPRDQRDRNSIKLPADMVTPLDIYEILIAKLFPSQYFANDLIVPKPYNP